MRSIVFTQHQKVMYGGIMFSAPQNWGGLFVSQKHISFEFSQGVTFKDPNSHLEGIGKNRRHLKIRSLDDIIEKEVEFYVKQAC